LRANICAQRRRASPTLALLGHDFRGLPATQPPGCGGGGKRNLGGFSWSIWPISNGRCNSLFDAPGAEQEGYATVEQADDPRLRLQPCVRCVTTVSRSASITGKLHGKKIRSFPPVREEHLAW